MLVPHNSKITLALKPHTSIEITKMYYTNYHMTNHNVETCKVFFKKRM
jgi:hypothetical protein